MQEWLMIALFVIVATLGAACWWRLLFSRDRLKPFFRNQAVAARWGFLDLVMIFGLWVGSQIVATSAALLILGIPPENLSQLDGETLSIIAIGSTLLQILVVFISMFYLVLRYQHNWSHLWNSFDDPQGRLLTEFKRGAMAFVMWVPVVWLVQYILIEFVPYKHPTVEALRKDPQWIVLIQSWVSAVCCAPIIEEILFRGILQGWLQRFGDTPPISRDRLFFGDRPETYDAAVSHHNKPFSWWPILMTAVLFGAAHSNQGPAPVTMFVLSIGLGYLYQRTGSLLACIVMHTMINIVGMTFFTFEIFFE